MEIINSIIKWLRIASIISLIISVLSGVFGLAIDLRRTTSAGIPFAPSDFFRAWLIITGYLILALLVRLILQRRSNKS